MPQSLTTSQGIERMKICYIANAASLHTQRWVSGLVKRGHEVHLISEQEANIEGVQLHRLTTLAPRMWAVSKYLNVPLWAISVKRMVKEIKPDIIDAQYVIVEGFLGAFSGFHPLVLTAWGSDILIAPKQKRIHRSMVKYSLKRADLIVCRTPFMKEEIIRLGANPGKIERIFLGVDTAKFNPSLRSEQLRQELDTSDSQPLVISIRNLAPLYNVEALVRAIPLVLKEVPQAKFLIAGGGPQKNYLEKLSQSLGTKDSVRFVGQIPHDELPRYLASSEVYVSTSLSDGVPSSLLEGMASGLAPVVTDIPANRLWIEDSKNGFLVPIKDAEALAIKISQLLKDGKTRNKFGEISRRIVQEKGEHKTQLEKLESLYLKLLGKVRK